MNAISEFKNFIEIDVDRQNKKATTQLYKAIMACLVVTFYSCWILASKANTFIPFFFCLSLLIALIVSYIPLYFFSTHHSLIHSFKYAFKFIRHLIFKKRLKHNLEKNFTTYYQYFSENRELDMFERFYNLIAHDTQYRYDNNHIVKSLKNIEQKHEKKLTPRTNFLHAFNEAIANKSLPNSDTTPKVEFFPKQKTVS